MAKTKHYSHAAWTISSMMKGQFYRSYTGGDGPDFYSSGLSGWRYWAVYLGILSSGQAIKM
jgi:hypothetical protein